MDREIVILQRDTMAYMVPSGARIMLHAGTEVKVAQSLGDSFTVDVYGNLARIDGQDADALGKDKLDPLSQLPTDASVEDRAWTLLKSVYDPEIPVNIVDLGLIYSCDISEAGSNQFTVVITMTLTAPGCGMGPVIAEDVKRVLLSQGDIVDVEVDIVFDPQWERSMMSPEAKLELGMF